MTENQSSQKQQTQINNQLQNSQKDESMTLNQVRDVMRGFVDQREWHQFHTPRNLLLAMVGEVGEISEIFQWKGQVSKNVPEFSQKEKTHLGQQLADVLSYLIRLSDVCGVDLSKAFEDKVEKNRKKYPKEMVKGSSKKYNEYKQQAKQQKGQENTQSK